MTIEQDLYTRVYQYKGYWKLTVQQHGQRKSFYSKIPGNAGRKECARQAAAWLAQDTPIVPSSRLLVKDVFPLYLKDRALQTKDIYTIQKYSLQGTTQGNGLTGGLPPVRFSM